MIGSRSDVRTGLRWGATYAAVYGALGAAAFLARGPAAFGQSTGLTLLKLVLLYLLAGILGGLLVGGLLPLGRRLGGAVVLGWLGAAPFFFGGALTMMPSPERTWHRVVLVTVLGALFPGSLCGAGLWWRIGPGASRRR